MLERQLGILGVTGLDLSNYKFISQRLLLRRGQLDSQLSAVLGKVARHLDPFLGGRFGRGLCAAIGRLSMKLFRIFAGEDHFTVPFVALNRALRFALGVN